MSYIDVLDFASSGSITDNPTKTLSLLKVEFLRSGLKVSVEA